MIEEIVLMKTTTKGNPRCQCITTGTKQCANTAKYKSDITNELMYCGIHIKLVQKQNIVLTKPISFQKFYGYNEKGVESEEQRFKTFLSGIQSILEQKGIVSIEVEGSASYVPTRTFGSNKKLSTYRSEEAKEMLMTKLKAAGVNLSQVKIVTINSVVQGPKYKGDFKDTEKYGKFQYIKLKAF